MSKSSEFDKVIKRYILDRVDGSGYDIVLANNKDKIKFISKSFASEMRIRISQAGELKAMTEWYQGLCSAVNVDFQNYNILKLAENWGYLATNASESRKNKLLNGWWNLLATKTLQLIRQEDK